MTTNTGNAGLSTNLASALCYLLGLISGIAFLVIAPYNQDKEIRFHAFQSIFLNIAWIVFWVVFNVITSMFGLYVLYLLTPLISLAALGAWLYLMYTAYQGKKIVLPVIGPLAEQQA
ncbi:MAG: hypothetical protein U0360_05260 [Dehalococcoidia bacterium]